MTLQGVDMFEKEAKERAKDYTDNAKRQVAYECGFLDGAEPREKRIAELEKEIAELKKVAEFQQSSNMSRHFENKKLKEVLAVGSTFNKALNSMNKSLEEGRDKYRNMVFDKNEQLTKAKKLIQNLLDCWTTLEGDEIRELKAVKEAEQFLKEVEE